MASKRQPAPLRPWIATYPEGVAWDAELDIRPGALAAIARKALKRKTGARGLRSIIEASLLDTMYDLPSQGNISRVVLDENVIDGDGKPLLIYNDEQGKSAKPERGEVRDAAA